MKPVHATIRWIRADLRTRPGQALLSEVPLRAYVIANYPETQLARMRVGLEPVLDEP